MLRCTPARRRRAAVGLLALFLTQTLAGPALAVTLAWSNPAGGGAGAAANWLPVQIPVEADILQFALPVTYTVNFQAGVDSVAAHQVFAGDVTINPVAPHGIQAGFHVASLPGQFATARVTAGTLRAGWAMSVGAGAAATGTFRISGGTADVFQNVIGAPGSGPVLDIGGGSVSGGTGEVVVINGGKLELAHHLNVGRHTGGVGTLRVRGAGSTGSGTRRSTAFAENTAGEVRVGYQGGTGHLEVQDGGLFRAGHVLLVAPNAGDTGDIQIVGENNIDSSQVRVQGDLLVGANLSTALGVAGGSGTVTLDSLGVLVVDDSTVVGDSDGSSASLVLMPHSRMRTGSLVLRQPSGGSVDLQGGTLQVDGGWLTTANGRLAIPGTEDAPIVQLMNGATAEFNATAPDHPLAIGTASAAIVLLQGGSSVTANGAPVTIAGAAGPTSVLDVSGGSSFSTDDVIEVGSGGIGYLNVSDGSVVADGVDVNPAGGALGSVQVNGASGSLTSSGSLNIGGSTLFASGPGFCTVANGGVLHLTAPLNAGTVWGPSSQLYVGTGGAVDMNGILTVRGNVGVSGGGTISGGKIALRGSGRLDAQGVVASGLLAGADTTVAVAATGDLELGRDDAGGDVLLRGSLGLAGHRVTIHDPDSAFIGVVDLAAGDLVLPAGGGVIEAGKRLTGSGDVFGPLVNHGIVQSIGPARLVFHGDVTHDGSNFGGHHVEFGRGVTFAGRGAIAAKIWADSGSVVRATGDLTLGTGANLAVTLFPTSLLDVGAHHVTLLSPSNPAVDGDLRLDGGTLSLAGGAAALYLNGATLSGRGTVDADLIGLQYDVSPGFSAGRLHVNGDFQAGGGAYVAELGDAQLGECDTLSVAGTAGLTGTLDLRRLPSFAASAGDSFCIMTFANLNAVYPQFTTVTLDGAPATGLLEVHYHADGVWVVMLQTLDVAGGAAPPAGPHALRLAPLGSPGFSPAVELALPAAADARVHVYDVHGRAVATLHTGALAAGVHRLELPRTLAGAGVYFVRASLDDGRATVERTTRLVRLR